MEWIGKGILLVVFVDVLARGLWLFMAVIGQDPLEYFGQGVFAAQEDDK
jgi:hypothetical protein